LGLEADQAEQVWRVLIDWNVAYEKRTIAARLEKGEGQTGFAGFKSGQVRNNPHQHINRRTGSVPAKITPYL
jgi:hypothetical protein